MLNLQITLLMYWCRMLPFEVFRAILSGHKFNIVDLDEQYMCKHLAYFKIEEINISVIAPN